MSELIGRNIELHTPYQGGDGQLHSKGIIVEWLGGMRFGVQFLCYFMGGQRITVDFHRSEFIMGKANKT